jgi:hypothetical protein
LPYFLKYSIESKKIFELDQIFLDAGHKVIGRYTKNCFFH